MHQNVPKTPKKSQITPKNTKKLSIVWKRIVYFHEKIIKKFDKKFDKKLTKKLHQHNTNLSVPFNRNDDDESYNLSLNAARASSASHFFHVCICFNYFVLVLPKKKPNARLQLFYSRVNFNSAHVW